MKKEMYDASIHVGQFSLDEETRIRCKNAQVRITSKEGIVNTGIDEVIGVVTYGENTESDNVIWETLGRKEQDVFYPRMDVYHSIKNIEKVRDSNSAVKALSIKIEQDFGCRGTDATVIAGAILSGCSKIYTLYKELLDEQLVKKVQDIYGISIMKPELGEELTYSGKQIVEDTGEEFNLEELYQKALSLYRNRKIDLVYNLLMVQKDRS